MSLLEPPQDLLALLREAVNADEEGESIDSEDVFAYVTFLAAGLCDAQDFTPTTWKDVLQPYLEGIDTISAESVEKFRESAQHARAGEDDVDSYGDDDDDGLEEVCNIRFK
jgi:hypothetical protein